MLLSAYCQGLLSASKGLKIIYLMNRNDGMQTITFKPLDPGIVLEKLVVDYGGYKKSYLFMNESKSKS